MITEFFRDWWLRWLDLRSSRSSASKRLRRLQRDWQQQHWQRQQQSTARHRRLDGNRGHHWSTEATTMLPPVRPLMTYGQSVGYRVLLPSSA